MIRYFSVLIFFLCSCLPTWGQEPQWHEPFFININLGGSLRFDTQIDNVGNVYAISVFKNEVTILDTTLYSSMGDGVFLAKFDENQNLLWAKLLADTKEETPNFSSVIGRVFLEIDEETNNIYPSIGYGDSILLDSQLFTVDQSQEDYQDIVIFKMSDEGITEDMYHIKGNCESYIGDIEVRNEYLYFHFANARHSLDSDSICTCAINSDTTINIEINSGAYGRLNVDSGNVDWVKTYEASGSAVNIEKIAIGESKMYLTGLILWPADLTFEDGVLDIPNTYTSYGYLTQHDLNGNLEWTKYFAVYGWDSYATPRDIEINSDNDIVLIGNVKTQSVMNKVHFQDGSYLTGAQNNDASFFIVNYDSLGNIKWKDISQSIGYESIRTVDVDNDKNIYMTGTYNEQITFGSTVLESNMFSNDIIVLSYDSAGNKRWAQKAGGNGSDVGSVIHVDSDGDLRIAGSVTGSSATFGAYQTTPPTPGNSIFITQMKLEPIGLFETTPQQFGVSVYPNPSIGTTNIEVVDEFISQVKIYNGFGQEIKNLNFDSQTDKVNVENLSSGYYILDIHVESGKHVAQKLIVK